MSVLEEAPQDRVPIQTYVMEYNEEMVREAISRELARGGQVYYVYNQVNTIAEVTDTIASAGAGGQCGFCPRTDEGAGAGDGSCMDFINGEIDVLVSTTIIETGLDISNVNTMIIHDADQLGLSQLYQLRGRVGPFQPDCLCLSDVPERSRCSKKWRKSVCQAIREFTELGSGFKIAMRDLETAGSRQSSGGRATWPHGSSRV